jgi:myo-inositol catabolism protein IolC
MTEAQTDTGGTPSAHAARPLLILAADHRNSLERDLYGLTAAPTPEQAARISADKMLIYHALLDAVPHLPASVQPGILIDEQYGAAIDRHDDAVAIAAAAKRGGRTADCIVLGRDASHDHLDHWLQVAAPVPGFTGFAIGRGIWCDPLHAHLHHRSTASGARRRIANRYLNFARYFVDARDGTLPVQYEPETL